MHQIFLIQLVVSAFMTGFVWFAQIVHYPLLLKIGPESFGEYQKENLIRSAGVAIPIMCIEGITAFSLVYLLSSSVSILNLSLLILIWISTATLQAPRHLSLQKEFDKESIGTLIRLNWIRTVLWTGRTVLLCSTLLA